MSVPNLNVPGADTPTKGAKPTDSEEMGKLIEQPKSARSPTMGPGSVGRKSSNLEPRSPTMGPGSLGRKSSNLGDRKVSSGHLGERQLSSGSLARKNSGLGSGGSRRGSDQSSARGSRRPSLLFVPKDQGVPLNFTLIILNKQVLAQAMYSDLAVFVPFLVLFVFFFLGGRDTQANYFAIRAIQDMVINPNWPTTDTNIAAFKDQIGKEVNINVGVDHVYGDIGNAGDWPTWLLESAVQNTWDCANPDTNHQNLAKSGQNYHVGAMRIRTIRVRNDSCSFNSDLVKAKSDGTTPWLCYDKHTRWSEETRPFHHYPYVSSDHEFGETTTAREGLYHPGGYTVEIPFNATCNEARAIAQELATLGFVDNFATRFVTAEYFIYSPQFDTFHGIKLYTEVTAGGAWIAQYKFRSFQIRTAAYLDQMILDFFFLAFVLYYVARYFYDFYKAFVKKKVKVFFFDFWNFLEIANLVIFGVVFGFRFRWWYVSEQANIRIPFTPAIYPHILDDVMVLYQAQIYSNSLNTILTFLKLLKFVRVNARLSVLTETMAECQASIIGVLILFIFVIIAYAITGLTLFGSNMEGYRSIGEGISTLLRMLVGTFDYPAMHQINRFLSGFFFWSFVIIALFLLLNFVIAILSEAFGKVSGKAYAEPLDQTIVKMVTEWKLLLHKDNLKAMYKLLVSGSSAPAQVELILDDLQQYYDANTDETEEDPKVIMMTQKNLTDWVRPEAPAALGPRYMEVMWIGLVNDFDDAKKSSEEGEIKAVIEVIREGVTKSIHSELEKIDRFDDALTAIERSVAFLLEKHEKKVVG